MNTDLESIQRLASSLSGTAVRSVELIAHGGNNRVFRIQAAGRKFALKLYPRLDEDPRDRLTHEFDGLEFLKAAGIGGIPMPIACDRELRAALYTWIEGAPVTTHGVAEVDQLVAFMRRLHAARSLPGAQNLPVAAEAVFTGAELVGQIERRLVRFGAVAGKRRELAELVEAVRDELIRRLPPGEYPLASALRTLSPSDLGFHNTIRLGDGGLGFIDFEYFGWDDPVKLVSDVLWHPGHQLSDEERLHFRRQASDIYSADSAFQARLYRQFPLYGLRWALIVLNEFLPLAWKRRRFAGRLEADRQEIEERQLAKAQDLLAAVRAI